MCGEQWIPDVEGVTKGFEKKGPTKARRHKVFLGLPELRGQTKKASLVPWCLGALVPLWFNAFLLFATPSFEVVAKG